MKINYQLIIFVCCVFGVAVDAKESPSDVLTKALAIKYERPREALKLIEDVKHQVSLKDDREAFDLLSLSFSLNLKTEQFEKAHSSLEQIKKQFKESAEFADRIVLLESLLLLQQRSSEKLESLIESNQHLGDSSVNYLERAQYLFAKAAFKVQQYQFDKAMEILSEAQKLIESKQAVDLEMAIQNVLVQIFYYTRQYDKAIDVNQQMIDQAVSLKDRYIEVKALSNKMNIYYMRAVVFANEHKVQNASEHPQYAHYMEQTRLMQEQVFELANNIMAIKTLLRSLIIEQNLKLNEGNFEASIETGETIKSYANVHGFNYEGAVAANNLAIAYRESGRFDQAINELKLAEVHYQKLGDLQCLAWLYEDFAKTYEMAGNFEQALTFNKKFNQMNLSIVNKTNSQTLLDLQQKYTLAEKTAKIEQLTQKVALNAQQLETEKLGRWLLIAILVATAMFALFLCQKRKTLQLMLRKEEELNRKINEINKAKQRFFANLSHEFRTALTLSISPLKSYLAQLKPKTNEAVESALENNLHMLTLLNEVLDIERIDANSLPLHVVKMHLNSAVENCLHRFQLECKQKDIKIEKVDLEDVAFYFDASHFEKILANLVSNAVKYCGHGSTIKIKLVNKKRRFVLEISDNGPGIDENELPHIFNRFYQGKNSVEKHLPGTGIGLSMVKELVEMHHGSIHIDSQKGFGCKATIMLNKGKSHYEPEVIEQLSSQKQIEKDTNSPVEQAEEHQESSSEILKTDALSKVRHLHQPVSRVDWEPHQHIGQEESDEQSEQQKQRPVVLIVDDNPKIRQLIRGIIQADYHLAEASNGEEALKIAQAIQPDLIIADIMMPKMNGLQLTKTIRANEKLAHLSIILLTALSETAQKVQGLDVGADDYISKPFDNEELRARVKSHLSQKQRLSKKLYQQMGAPIKFDLAQQGFEDQESKRSKRLEALIVENLGECEFGIEQMYTELNMTRSSLYRYTQKVYGCTPMNLLKQKRLQVGFQMLQETSGTISEIAYAVGYQSLSAFSRAFRDQFNYPPTKVKRDARTPGAMARSVTELKVKESA